MFAMETNEECPVVEESKPALVIPVAWGKDDIVEEDDGGID